MPNTNPAIAVMAWSTLRILGLPLMRGQEQDVCRQGLGGSREMQVRLSLLQRFRKMLHLSKTNVPLTRDTLQHMATCDDTYQNAAACGNGDMLQCKTKCGGTREERRQYASGASLQLARLLLS
jgi:hypothetical protein